MSKLALKVDELKVDSFDMGGEGSVPGNAARCTCWETCGGTPNCETWPPYC